MSLVVDLDALPQILCRDRRPRTEPAISICLHVPVTAENSGIAEAVARYLQNPGRIDPKDGVWKPVTAGIHHTTDDDSIVMCADPRTETVPHCYRPSGWSVGIEMAGTVQSAIDWDDDFSQATLRNTARLCATLCREFTIPVVRLDPFAVGARNRGLFDHWTATQACRIFGWPEDGHTDVGPEFPWTQFLALVESELNPPEEDEDDMARRWGFALSGADANGFGQKPYIEVDETEAQIHGYMGATFDPRDLVDGTPPSVTTIDLVKVLKGTPIRFYDRDGDSVIVVAQGGSQYRFTAVTP
jgi:hypothetical protein